MEREMCELKEKPVLDYKELSRKHGTAQTWKDNMTTRLHNAECILIAVRYACPIQQLQLFSIIH